MFKTILVPLDGSSRAERALPVATRIARTSGATIVLARVVSFLSEYWPPITTAHPSTAETFMKADLEEASAYLDRVASSAQLAGISVKTAARFGPIVPTILAAATAYASDLIILCGHGHPGIAHWMMGGIAEKIARHASIPVLVLREEGTRLGSSPADLAQPLRLLVPLDGSAEAQAALEAGATLLTAIAAPGQQIALHLVRVISPHVGQPADHQESAGVPFMSYGLTQAKQFLSQTVKQLREGQLAPTVAGQHIPVTWSVVLDKDIAQALLRVAEQGEDTEGAGVFGGCELIAISNRGRSGFRNWVLGSITERIMHATRRPILIVRPPEPITWKGPMVAREHKDFSSSVLY